MPTRSKAPSGGSIRVRPAVPKGAKAPLGGSAACTAGKRGGNIHCDPIVIIGAGPAGLSCALELATHGHDVVLVDDNACAGGQYLRQLPPGYRVSPGAKLQRDQACFDALARVLAMPNVRYLPATLVWGLAGEHTLCYASPTASGRITAENIVIATGAQEKSLPLPG